MLFQSTLDDMNIPKEHMQWKYCNHRDQPTAYAKYDNYSKYSCPRLVMYKIIMPIPGSNYICVTSPEPYHIYNKPYAINHRL